MSYQPPSASMTSDRHDNHSLFDKWTLWAHLPHDTNWSMESYRQIHTIESVENVVALVEHLPDALVRNCMLFMMREGIQPTWEDPRNRNGGCFSYKVTNKLVPTTWRNLMMLTACETAATQEHVSKDITGITISPKKNFCIVKIWMGSCKYQDPNSITGINGPAANGCIFKKQTPEY